VFKKEIQQQLRSEGTPVGKHSTKALLILILTGLNGEAYKRQGVLEAFSFVDKTFQV